MFSRWLHPFSRVCWQSCVSLSPLPSSGAFCTVVIAATAALIAALLSAAATALVVHRKQNGCNRQAQQLDRTVADQTRELTNVARKLCEEIVEHHRTEEMLRDREEKFQQMAEYIEEVFWILDLRTGEAIYVSPAFEHLTGRPVSSITDGPLSYREIIHPLDRDRILRALSQAGGTTKFNETFRISRTNDEVRWVSSKGYGVRDAAGNIYRLVGVTQDVTESKQQEDEHRRLAAIVEFSDDAIISKDLNGIIQSWNKAAERIFGYTEGEVIGKPVAVLVPSESQDEEIDILRRIRNGEHIQHYQTVRVTKSGEPIDVSLTISPIRDTNGTIIGASKIARDIREYKRVLQELENRQKESKAQADELAVVLDAIPGMVLIARDSECRRLTGSRTTYDLLRAPYGSNLSKSAPPNEMPRTFRALKNGIEIPVNRLPLQVATAERREVRDSEITFMFEDGTTRDFVGNAAPFRDSSGHVSGAIGVFIDITQRNVAEHALREMEGRLARVSRSLTMGELTANIAHEVNQPLTAAITDIGAALRWLAQRPPNLNETTGALMAAIMEANRASDVIGRVRALVKNTSPSMFTLDLNELVSEVLQIGGRDIQACEVGVTTMIHPDATSVLGDRIQIEQVFLNLMMNAIDAMRSVTSRPRQLLITSEPQNGNVLIRVEDNGRGIQSHHVDQLFEPFFTTKISGIGMGLSISRSIVETHGGKLWAERVSPHGACFRFTMRPGKE